MFAYCCLFFVFPINNPQPAIGNVVISPSPLSSPQRVEEILIINCHLPIVVFGRAHRPAPTNNLAVLLSCHSCESRNPIFYFFNPKSATSNRQCSNWIYRISLLPNCLIAWFFNLLNPANLAIWKYCKLPILSSNLQMYFYFLVLVAAGFNLRSFSSSVFASFVFVFPFFRKLKLAPTKTNQLPNLPNCLIAWFFNLLNPANQAIWKSCKLPILLSFAFCCLLVVNIFFDFHFSFYKS